MTPINRFNRILTLTVAALALASILPAQADNGWCVGGSTLPWATLANWKTDAGGGTTVAAVPGAGNTATFNTTAGNSTATIVSLAGALTLGGIVVNNTGTTAIITDNGADRTITLGAGGITINAGAGAVQFGTNAASQKVYFTLGAAQSWINNGSSLLNIPGANGAGSLNLGAYQLIMGGSGNITHAGYIGGSGGIRKTGAGTVTIGSVCSYSGGITIEGGILLALGLANGGANSSLGASAASAANLVFGGGTLKYSTAAVASTDRLFTIGNANGLTATIDSSATSSANTLNFTNTGSLVLFTTASDRTLTLTGSNTGTNTFTPVIGDGAGGGKTAMVKSGAGLWILNSASTYTGDTTISSGTLTLGSSATMGSANIVVNGTFNVSTVSGGYHLTTGKTLKGTGTVTGPVTVDSGATITVAGSTGTTMGTLTVNGGLTLAGTTTLRLNKGGSTASDLITKSSGTLAFGGTLTLSSVGSALAAGDQFTIFATNGTGSFTSISPATPGTGLVWDTSLLNSNGIIKVISGSAGGSTNISFSVIPGAGPGGAGQLVLNWPASGWMLQYQSNSLSLGLSTNWVDLTGATPPFTNNVIASAGAIFYRLRQLAVVPTYSVTYNGNGSTGGVVPSDPNNPYVSGATATVLSAGSLTNAGYTFAGWNTAANGSGTGYGPGSTFPIGGNTTLYAQWAVSGISAALVIYDEALASGWSMNGWSSTSDTANTSPVHGGTKSIAFNLSAGGGLGPFKSSAFVNTATYSALSFWINGGAGGGQVLGMQFCRNSAVAKSITLDALPANTWTNIVLSLSSIGLANVTDFNCFRFTSTPAATFYVDDVQLSGATVYALAYNGNGNSSGAAPTDGSSPYVAGATATVLGAGTLGKTGYTFTGWNTTANGGGLQYSAGDTLTIASNTTLYAQWSPSGASYTVTYNGNGNTGGTVPTDPNSPYLVGSSVTVLGNTGGLVKTNYTFGGWNTTTNGAGTSYNPGGTFTIGTNTILYAQWNPPAFSYAYTNYNLGLLDPQLTGWPLTIAESNFIVTADYNRRPGSEVSQYLPQYWPITPSAGYWGSGAPDTGWLNYHTQLVTNDVLTHPGPLDILLVGDSITAQWAGQFGAPWNSSWQTYFSNYTAINIGIGGDKTQNVLWRLDHGGVQGLQPKVCVLQIGNNDMYFTPQTGTDAAVQGIITCVKNLRNKFPNTPIILVNVFPIVSTTGNQFFLDLKATHDGLNATNYPAQDPMVHSLDLWNQMIQGDGTGNPALFYDGTHPNATGYTLWATNMLPLVQSLVGH
jgi:uncharacterized repeat protein (TIGR02543 family)